jgi:Flp pilus assembly protein TadG
LLSFPKLLSDEDGVGTVWWVFWMIIFLMFGGVAADSSNAWRMRAELQATADAAAHAGVIDLPNQTAAAAAADGIAAKNMQSAEHGDVLTAAEIEFGA